LGKKKRKGNGRKGGREGRNGIERSKRKVRGRGNLLHKAKGIEATVGLQSPIAIGTDRA